MPIQPYCPGTDCPLKYECKRYKVDINVIKDIHLSSAPYNHVRKYCSLFIGDREKQVMKTLKIYFNQ